MRKQTGLFLLLLIDQAKFMCKFNLGLTRRNQLEHGASTGVMWMWRGECVEKRFASHERWSRPSLHVKPIVRNTTMSCWTSYCFSHSRYSVISRYYLRCSFCLVPWAMLQVIPRKGARLLSRQKEPFPLIKTLHQPNQSRCLPQLCCLLLPLKSVAVAR